MLNAYEYAEPIWAHFSAPAHAGELAAGADVIVAEAGSPAAKSLLRMQLRLAQGRVAEARFKAYGCPSAIAVGEWLAQWLSGKSPQEWRGLSTAKIRQALEIPDDRAHCALMGEDLVRALERQVEA